jgi:hypothetical protein
MKKILFIFLLLSIVTQQASAQCNPDRHSTSWYDGWISCQKSNNPNSERGITHWVLYDLGEIYALSTTKFWNSNNPNHLDYGIQEMIFDYSIDGINWNNLGVFTFSEASGKTTYEGIDGPDFDNKLARYVLLTPTSNYGGSCYGFSELKLNIGDEVLSIDPEIGFAAVAFPNPFEDEITVRIDTLFPDKTIEYSITDLLGRTILFDSLDNLSGTNTFTLTNNELNLATGIYLLSIYQNNQQQTIKIVKE